MQEVFLEQTVHISSTVIYLLSSGLSSLQSDFLENVLVLLVSIGIPYYNTLLSIGIQLSFLTNSHLCH